MSAFVDYKNFRRQSETWFLPDARTLCLFEFCAAAIIGASLMLGLLAFLR